MRRRRISSFPAAASKYHLPPLLDDRDRHRPVLGADVEHRGRPRGIELEPLLHVCLRREGGGVVAVRHRIRGRHQRLPLRAQDRLQLRHVEPLRRGDQRGHRLLRGGERPLRHRRRALPVAAPGDAGRTARQPRRVVGDAHGHGVHHRRPPPPPPPPAAATATARGAHARRAARTARPGARAAVTALAAAEAALATARARNVAAADLVPARAAGRLRAGARDPRPAPPLARAAGRLRARGRRARPLRHQPAGCSRPARLARATGRPRAAPGRAALPRARLPVRRRPPAIGPAVLVGRSLVRVGSPAAMLRGCAASCCCRRRRLVLWLIWLKLLLLLMMTLLPPPPQPA